MAKLLMPIPNKNITQPKTRERERERENNYRSSYINSLQFTVAASLLWFTSTRDFWLTSKLDTHVPQASPRAFFISSCNHECEEA